MRSMVKIVAVRISTADKSRGGFMVESVKDKINDQDFIHKEDQRMMIVVKVSL